MYLPTIIIYYIESNESVEQRKSSKKFEKTQDFTISFQTSSNFLFFYCYFKNYLFILAIYPGNFSKQRQRLHKNWILTKSPYRNGSKMP